MGSRVRLHPISAALQFLKGHRTLRGRQMFEDDEQAAEVLHALTGQDFGTDGLRWGEWLRQNRIIYYRSEGGVEILGPTSHFRRYGQWPSKELTKKKRRPRKPANWQQAPIRMLLELI